MSTGLVRGLVIGVIVALVVIAGLLVALFGWAHSSGEDLQKNFFTAVLSGDANRVTALMHPALREEVDEPVLEQWQAAVRANLGEFRKLSGTDFNTSSSATGAGHFTETKGTVEFEKGTASSELKFKDGQLMGFHVTSDRIPDGWFKGLPESKTALYRQRGEKFLRLFLDEQADPAFAMMHESLQKVVPLERLRKRMADTVAQTGTVEGLAYASEEVGPSGKLKIVYRLEAQKVSRPISVQFSFLGMKGRLVAFDFTGKDD